MFCFAKSEVDKAVAEFLSLKAKYKELSGRDCKPGSNTKPKASKQDGKKAQVTEVLVNVLIQDGIFSLLVNLFRICIILGY